MTWTPFRFDDYRPDAPEDAELPTAWSALTNVAFRDGIGRRPNLPTVLSDGATNAGINFVRFMGAWNRTLGDERGLIYGGLDTTGDGKVGYWAGSSAHADVTPAAWSTGAVDWTGGFFGNGFLISKGAENAAWIPPTAGTGTDLGVGPFVALRPYRYQAIGIGGATYGYGTVRWSSSTAPSTAPTTWTPAAGNDAGDVDLLGSGTGLLLDGGALGDDFLVYGSDSMHRLTYVGGTTVMEARRISNTGILWTNTWADLGDRHAVLTDDDLVTVTPSGITESLIRPAGVRRAIFDDIWTRGNTTRPKRARVIYSMARGELIVLTPSDSADNLSKAWIMEMASGRWGSHALTAAAAYQAGAVMARSSGNDQNRSILVLGRTAATESALSATDFVEYDPASGTQSDAASVWQKDGIDLGDSSRRKRVRGIRVRGEGAVEVSVEIGTKNSPNASYTYGSAVTYTLGTDVMQGYLTDGRWLSVRLTVAANTQPTCRIAGFDLDADMAGNW